MQFLSCEIPAPEVVQGVVTRTVPGEPAATQTLAACRRELRPLTGADAHGGLELGPPLQLYADPAPLHAGVEPPPRRPYAPRRPFHHPVWDPFSSAVYLCEGHGVARLGGDGWVALVAGAVTEKGEADGPGTAARFRSPRYLVSDGQGALYVAQERRIRKLQLPRAAGLEPGQREAAPAGGGSAAAAAPAAAAGGRAPAAAAGGEVLVSTLPLLAPADIWGLAYDDGEHGGGSGGGGASGGLLFMTDTALYRLPLGDPAAGPLLLAGREGARGAATGAGADARFNSAYGIVRDGEGNVYASDLGANSLRRVAADGTVSSAAAGLRGSLDPAILPNGCLALCRTDGGLHVLGLGLKLPRLHAAAPPLPPPPPAGPPPRTLPADMCALLGRQPDAFADVAIEVSGRTFHAHSAVLAARSDYWRQCLGGACDADSGAGSGSQQQQQQQQQRRLSLPGAEAAAFEVVLRFVYTGAADVPPALAEGVAELAARLLLPELRELAAAVAAGAPVAAVTVAGLAPAGSNIT
ncbi:ARM REPEAT PROTEIN INTERACTING WITH ABF2 [Tetrabaena socialis]|uniref:ARM REPEAT PROTEIN INTERACTING WITH ABF2 n=1 Tax=Tetrabaena socialis TaxID=47790 RepID=A0A2J7ZS55_9CHLO|nr:ARM REPEAT PROTEIN INTERACTING WITH ABF2 [Tetrabaena socialis]|eukprot:PNH03101.1 ARM REPEAT PROTEIN INTERACTING WITH ABF2 [Tetrabaena socialis]